MSSKQPSWSLSALVILACAMAGHAQKTDRVEIDLRPCARTPTRVWFVLNGLEQKELDPAARHWLISVPGDKFVIQDACASLRLGGARTNCQRAVPANDPEHRYAPLARFVFTCDEQDAWPVSVQTTPPIPGSYVRTLENSKTTRGPLDCTCKEKDSFDGKRTLLDVRFPVERLLLQLNVKPPDDKATGLNINAINLKKNPNKDEYTFNREGVAGLLSVQRVKGDRSAPNLSSTAIDIDTARMKKVPLTNLTVTVN